jgi:hypothetical protein
MRLSEWRAAAPHKDAVSARVVAAVDPVLAALGSGGDPHAWIVWGEEPSVRYTILVPTDPGLVVCFVRVLVPGEGPRASAKLVRWSRLAVEAQEGHRLLSVQVDQQVLRGVDAEADRAAAFALRVIAAIDGRPLPAVDESAPRGRRAGAARSTKATKSGRVAATEPRGVSAARSATERSARGARPTRGTRP